MVSIFVADVQAVYGGQDPAIDESQQETLVGIAERLTEDVFSGRIATFSEIEGNTDDFAAYLGAHLWEIAEGGEAQSSSQTGGSVNYQHLQTNAESTLGETRYGRTCLMMMRQNANTGIVRSDF